MIKISSFNETAEQILNCLSRREKDVRFPAWKRTSPRKWGKTNCKIRDGGEGKWKEDALIENFTNRLWQRSGPSTRKRRSPHVFKRAQPRRNFSRPMRRRATFFSRSAVSLLGKGRFVVSGIGVGEARKVKRVEREREREGSRSWYTPLLAESAVEERPRAARWHETRLSFSKEKNVRDASGKSLSLSLSFYSGWYFNALFASSLRFARYFLLQISFLVSLSDLKHILENCKFEQVAYQTCRSLRIVCSRKKNSRRYF